MLLKLKYRIILSSILFCLLCGIGFTESEIPFVFKHDLSVVNDRLYTSHSVTFTHAAHIMEYKITCVQCHHMLEPGATAVEERCADCHEGTDMRNYAGAREIISDEERIEYYILAIHDQCINCHKETKQHSGVAKVPVACWGCHIRKKK